MSGKYKAEKTTDSSGNQFRSKLESYCYAKLKENNLEFEYEPTAFILLDEFYHDFEVWEPKRSKGENVFSNLGRKINKVKYIPDFVGSDWIIETKGHRTPEFNIKWKMFKAYLYANNLHFRLFLPTSNKQIDLSIEIIKGLK